MQVQATPKEQGVAPGASTVQLEMSKQELATLIDGLTKIRDQLGSIK